MIARTGTGWQTLMADLSIILFMVTAAALAQAGFGDAAAASPAAPAAEPSARGEPIAVYRAGEDAPPLGDWLDEQPVDARQMLTVLSSYTPGKQGEAMARAAVFAEEAARRQFQTRVVVEPGNGDTTATLAYDLSIQPASAPTGSGPNSQGNTP